MTPVAQTADHSASSSDAKPTPFSQEWVTLTRPQTIELVMQARSAKSLHERALGRIEWLKAARRQQRQQALQREAELLGELEQAQARIRDLRQRHFGRHSERCWSSGRALEAAGAGRARGQQRGRAGHARSRAGHLPCVEEIVELDEPQCPACGLPPRGFAGTDDSTVREIEVRAYCRPIRRRRHRCACPCGVVPGIVAAPAVPRLIERGKFGISVWGTVLLDKFLYGRPSQRLLEELADRGLPMSAGSLAGGLEALAPLFAPLYQALGAQLRCDGRWHADETRWEVFVELEGKIGHRWYLWVFESAKVVHVVLDESRSSQATPARRRGQACRSDHRRPSAFGGALPTPAMASPAWTTRSASA